MRIVKSKDSIEIIGLEQFDIKQIFDCGQIFRYLVVENQGVVVSTDRFAYLKKEADKVIIYSKDLKYFEKFFDLDINYERIKEQLKKDNFLRPCCNYGFGIRLLKQDLFEMLVSFIISANNNIKRIKNSVNFLAKQFGEKIYLDKNFGQFLNLQTVNLIEKDKKGFYYYAFPKLKDLKQATIQDYVEAGLGYRAPQMYLTIQTLTDESLNNFKNLPLSEQKKFLLNLKGVGEKVMNCILLFTGYNMKSFPVDTWINKVYNELTSKQETNRSKIEKELTDRYKDLSGYAQQYFFYYYRDNKLN